MTGVTDSSRASASLGWRRRAATRSGSSCRPRRPCRFPTGVSSELAAAVLLQGVTAHYLATGVYPVQPGDDVLVHAAAGGVGLLLTQIVKGLGGRVIATTSGGEKAELARNAGADDVIGYEGFAERVRELTDGVGAAVVYDGVGRATFDESLASLRERGTMVLYGAASGAVPPFDPMRLEHGGSLFLTRPVSPALHGEARGAPRPRDRRPGRVARGVLDVRIGGRYPLEQARQAQEDLAARKTTGKVLLLHDDGRRISRTWDDVLEGWEPSRGAKCLRSYSDTVNGSLMREWLENEAGARVLKTDLFDEAVAPRPLPGPA